MYKDSAGKEIPDVLYAEVFGDEGAPKVARIYMPSNIDIKLNWSDVEEFLAPKLEVYFGRFRRINSEGSRMWHRNNPFPGRLVELHDVTSVFMAEISMKPDTIKNATVQSCYIDFNCKARHQLRILVKLDKNSPESFFEKTKNLRCQEAGCFHPLTLDTVRGDHLNFLRETWALRNPPRVKG